MSHSSDLAYKVASLVWQANREQYDLKGFVHFETVLQSETGAWGMELLDSHGDNWVGEVVWLDNPIQLYLDVKEAPEKYIGLLGNSDKYVALPVAKAFKGEL